MATLEIFNVAHGQCSLISSDSGAHMLIDCGHNGGTGWRPSEMLARRGVRWLDELVITNCDEDHASDLPRLLETVDIGCLTRNPTVSGNELYRLKASGGMGAGIASLVDMTMHFNQPAGSLAAFDGMTCRILPVTGRWIENSFPRWSPGIVTDDMRSGSRRSSELANGNQQTDEVFLEHLKATGMPGVSSPGMRGS